MDIASVRATTCNPGRFFATAEAADDWLTLHPDDDGQRARTARGRYGLQTMCEAGGTANATITERL